MNVPSILFDYVVHRRSVPSWRLRLLLGSKVNPESIFRRGSATLVAGIPRVGLIAAADDAVVADDVVLFGIDRNDRKLADLTLICHVDLP